MSCTLLREITCSLRSEAMCTVKLVGFAHMYVVLHVVNGLSNMCARCSHARNLRSQIGSPPIKEPPAIRPLINSPCTPTTTLGVFSPPCPRFSLRHRAWTTPRPFLPRLLLMKRTQTLFFVHVTATNFTSSSQFSRRPPASLMQCSHFLSRHHPLPLMMAGSR